MLHLKKNKTETYYTLDIFHNIAQNNIYLLYY